jgi:hypothetical protein
MNLPELNDLARERIGAGVEVFLECFANSDYSAGPAYASLRVTEQALSKVINAARACEENDWNFVELGLAPARWQGEDDDGSVDLRIRYWDMRVYKDALHFHGMPKEGNDSVESRSLDLAMLYQALTLEPDSEEMPENMAWFGGVLVYDTGNLDGLCEQLAEDYPEIEAQENALEMQRVIAEAPPADADVAPKRTRRLGL